MTAPLRLRCSMTETALVVIDGPPGAVPAWFVAEPGDDLVQAVRRVGRADAPRLLAAWRAELADAGAARVALRGVLPGGHRGTITLTGVAEGDGTCLVVASFDAASPGDAGPDAPLDVRAMLERLDAVYYELSRDERGVWSANYASPAWEALLGRPMPEDPVERSNLWMSSIHPDDIEATFARALDHARRKAPLAHEYRIVRGDGEVRWVRDHVTGFGGTEERPRVVGVTIDITEGKRRDERLARIMGGIAALLAGAPGPALPEAVRERLEALLEEEAAPRLAPGAGRDPFPMHFVVRLAPDGGMELVEGDAALGDFLGWLPATVAEVVHPDDLERVLCEVRAIVAGPGQGSQVFRVLGHDGSVRWLRTAFTVRPGDAPVIVGSAIDITAVAGRPPGPASPVVYEVHREADGRWRNDYLSPAATALFGDDLPSDPYEQPLAVRDRIHPDDLDALDAVVEEVAATGAGVTTAFRIVHPDGSVRRVRGMFNRVGTDPVRLAGAFSEAGTGAPAGEAERRLRVANALEDVVMEFACEGDDVSLRYVTPSANAVLGTPGLAPGARRARAWMAAVHPADLHAVLDSVRAVAGSGEVVRGAHRVVRPDGGIRWVRTVLGGGAELGRHRLVACVASDISDLAGALRLEDDPFADRLDHLVSAVSDGIWEIAVHDAVTRDVSFTFVSRRMWEILGLPEGPLDRFGAALEGAIHPDDRRRSRTQHAAMLAGSPDASEHRIVRPGGEVRWIRWSPAGARERFGTLHVTGTLSDVTDERGRRADATLPELTARQREVLDLLVSGASTEEMAHAMGIRPVTVSNHVAALLRRLGVRSRLEAVALALGSGTGPGS